jgi:hypothetical protein
MSVVTRGIMTAGMAIYAAIHFGQVRSSELDAAWADAGFLISAIVASVLAVALVLRSERSIEHAAAGLAVISMGALMVTEFVGLFGVDASSLQAEVIVVLVAEVFVIVAWGIEQFAPSLGHLERDDLEDERLSRP